MFVKNKTRTTQTVHGQCCDRPCALHGAAQAIPRDHNRRHCCIGGLQAPLALCTNHLVPTNTTKPTSFPLSTMKKHNEKGLHMEPFSTSLTRRSSYIIPQAHQSNYLPASVFHLAIPDTGPANLDLSVPSHSSRYSDKTRRPAPLSSSTIARAEPNTSADRPDEDNHGDRSRSGWPRPCSRSSRQRPAS